MLNIAYSQGITVTAHPMLLAPGVTGRPTLYKSHQPLIPVCITFIFLIQNLKKWLHLLFHSMLKLLILLLNTLILITWSRKVKLMMHGLANLQKLTLFNMVVVDSFMSDKIVHGISNYKVMIKY